MDTAFLIVDTKLLIDYNSDFNYRGEYSNV